MVPSPPVAARSPTQRFFGADSALFVGPLGPPVRHSHHAIQGCVALRGTLRVAVDRGEPVSAPGVLIAAGVRHVVRASGLVAHFYVLPESAHGASLTRALAGRPVERFGARALRPARGLLGQALRNERLFPECLAALLELALDEAPPEPRMDARVATVVERLRHRSVDASLAELAHEVGRSPNGFAI